MQYILLACFALAYYLMFFLLLGSTFIKRLKIKNSIPLSLIIGCFLYYIIFNFIALPMKLLFRPLSELALLWLFIVIIIFIFLFWKNYNYIKRTLIYGIKLIKRRPLLCIGFFALFAIQFIYIGSQSSWIIGVTDDRYYIGDIATSVFTNTIQQYDAITGKKLAVLSPNYLLQMYTVHSAVVCKVTGIPPLVENKWVLVGVWLILINCSYLLWGQLLFRDNDKKLILFLTTVTWIIYCQRKINVSTAAFLVYRTAEGKNILANLIVPFLIYLFARIVLSQGKRENWYLLFISVVASYCLVMSSVFLLPLLLGSFYACYILIGKRWQMLPSAIICFLPCIIIMGYYFLMMEHVLYFPVP